METLTYTILARPFCEGDICDVIVHVAGLFLCQAREAAGGILQDLSKEKKKQDQRTLPISMGPQKKVERTSWNGLQPSSQRYVNSFRERLSFSLFAACL